MKIWIVNRYGWFSDFRPATVWIQIGKLVIGVNKNGIIK